MISTDNKPGAKTSEFLATASVVATNLLTGLVLVGVSLGWVSSEDQDALNKAIAMMTGAVVTFLANGAMIWKYIQSRTSIKESEMAFRIQTMRLEAMHASAGAFKVGEVRQSE